MSDIYRQHDAAFSAVSAFVIMSGTARVATVAFKFPRDGAGRLFCYLQWSGLTMVRGFAGGGGYDKRSAAAESAAAKLAMGDGVYADSTPHHSESERASFDRFKACLLDYSGNDWQDRLRNAGFAVWQAV